MVTRKQLRAHDRKCERISKQVTKALKQADQWGIDRHNACKSVKCQNKTLRMEQKFLDKSVKLQGKESTCQRNRPN